MSIKAKRLFLFASFIIPSIFFTNYVLSQFYLHGTGLLDVGWFTYLLTNATSWPLKNPDAIGGFFFQTHFSVFFYATSYVYENILFFIPEPVYFSLFIGSMYGIISLSVFMVGLKLIKKVTFKISLILLSLSILSSMNGAALGLIGLPHIEIALPALILLFLSLHITGKKRVSFIIFILLLTIREDAGLHIFALLMTVLIIKYISTRKVTSLDLNLLFFAFAGFFYTIATMYIQKSYFPGDNALERVYLGNPTLSHLSGSFLVDRLGYFLTERGYIYIPAMLSVLAYFYTKNIFLLCGLLATLPWFFLSLIAVSAMPGSFSNYYAFPFVIIGVWPVFAFAIENKVMTQQLKNTKKIILSIIVITGTSVFLFPGNSGNVDSKPWRSFIFNDYEIISNTGAFIVFLNANKMKFGNILFDEPLAALFVQTLSRDEYGYLNNFSENVKNKADTVIFNNSNNSLNKSSNAVMTSIILDRGLNNIFKVDKTNIVIATNRTMKNNLSLIKVNLASVTKTTYLASELPSQVGQIQNNNRVAIETVDSAGFITYGPYAALEPGLYQFKITYSSQSPSSQTIGYWDVVMQLSTSIKELKSGLIYGTDGELSYIEKTFSVSKENSNGKVEIRSFYNGIGDLTVKKLDINRVRNEWL